MPSCVRNRAHRISAGTLQHRGEQFAHIGRIARDLDAALLHDRELFLGRTLAARDDRTGVAHALARGRCDPGNEADHGLAHIVLDPARAGFLIIAANLADHDDRIGFRVCIEQLHDIDMLHAIDRVAADADTGGLPEPELHQLAHGLVRQRPGPGDHTDTALLVDVPRHDADLYLVRRNHPGAVRSDEYGLLAAHAVARSDHVAHRH